MVTKIVSPSRVFLLLSVVLLQCNNSVYAAMRLVVQRVKSASVTVRGKGEVSSIGPGVMALVGLHQDDTEEDLKSCCKKLLAAKLFENEEGKLWRHGVKQKNFDVLLVSQFTLYGTLSKKNQPDYKLSMKAIPAEDLYNQFVSMVRENYIADKVKDGEFGAMMDVELVNDGPVTIMIESNSPLSGSSHSSSSTNNNSN